MICRHCLNISKYLLSKLEPFRRKWNWSNILHFKLNHSIWMLFILWKCHVEQSLEKILSQLKWSYCLRQNGKVQFSETENQIRYADGGGANMWCIRICKNISQIIFTILRNKKILSLVLLLRGMLSVFVGREKITILVWLLTTHSILGAIDKVNSKSHMCGFRISIGWNSVQSVYKMNSTRRYTAKRMMIWRECVVYKCQ